MPFTNPTPFIAYASLGARTPSSATPLPHAHPITPSANTPCNEQQTTNNEPSPAPPSSSPRTDFLSPHFALFLQVLHIASTVIVAIAQRMDSDLHCLTLLQGCEAINCLYSIIRIQLTIDRHPERITPAELRRLAKASRYINRLARQKLDFSPFTTTAEPSPGTADGLVRNPTNADQPASPSPNTPQSDNPQSSAPIPALRAPRLTGLPSTPVCHSPGATLARTCQSLCRLLKLLPDLAYDPSGTVATLDLSTLAAPSFSLGPRTAPSAIPLPPANPATPSPISPINEQQTTSNKPQTTSHKPFPTSYLNALPLHRDAVSGVRQPCCRSSSPNTSSSLNVPPSTTASAPT